MAKKLINVSVNGKNEEKAVEPRTLLIHFLREELNLTGAHIGCETSHRGACTVDIDGRSVKSCTHLAVQCDGSDVLTVEGLANKGVLHAVQEGFYQEHGLQCGFCTPGILMSLTEMLETHPAPDEAVIRDVLSGHLCRCTGYQNIVAAALKAVEAVRSGRRT